jgi:hypothetical protein
MKSKNKIAHKNYQEYARLSPVGPIESADEQVEAFDPEASVLNYMTWTIASYATRNRFVPPFRLRFTDANDSFFRESILRIKNDELWEQIIFEGSGQVQFPLSSELTDKRGRKHEMVVSTEDMQSWMNASATGGSRHIRFPAKIPNDSPEVFATVRHMLAAASTEGLEPPFTVEIRDASGELFDKAEIDADEQGEFRGGRDICHCAHLTFPVTIKLTSQSGSELTATVQRSF